MTVFAYGNWTFGVNLKRLLDRAKYLARVPQTGGLSTLADSASDQNQCLADMVGDAVQQFLDECPALGIKTAALAASAGVPSLTLPADLLGCQVQRLAYADSGSSPEWDAKPIPYAQPAEVDELPLSWRNGEISAERPERWGLDPSTRGSIILYPAPAAALALVLTYRQKMTPITAAQVAAPDAVSIGEAPAMALQALALRTAAFLVEGTDRARRDELLADYAAELFRLQGLLPRVPAASRPDSQGSGMGPLALDGLYSGLQPL